jgi:hypothetical protein
MRQLTLLASCLVALAAAAGAQPKHGDLILTVAGTSWTQGYTGYLNPASPGTLTTIAAAPANSFHNWVRMGSDNTSIAVSESNPLWTPCHLIHLTPGGSRTTIARNLDEISGFDLDHDGHWIAGTTYNPSAPTRNLLPRIAGG